MLCHARRHARRATSRANGIHTSYSRSLFVHSLKKYCEGKTRKEKATASSAVPCILVNFEVCFYASSSVISFYIFTVLPAQLAEGFAPITAFILSLQVTIKTNLLPKDSSSWRSSGQNVVTTNRTPSPQPPRYTCLHFVFARRFQDSLCSSIFVDFLPTRAFSSHFRRRKKIQKERPPCVYTSRDSNLIATARKPPAGAPDCCVSLPFVVDRRVNPLFLYL